MIYNTMPLANDILNYTAVPCDKCGHSIELLEDRTRCFKSKMNFCSSCSLNEEIDGVYLKGFPQLNDSLDELINKSHEIFQEMENQFDVPNNIFFSIAARLGIFLKLKSTGNNVRGMQKSFNSWLEDHGEEFYRRYVSLKHMGRYVDYFDRRGFYGTQANPFTVLASQGTTVPLSWNGIPMMRTVWDFALAPIMFSEIKPKTVIELGAAAGGTAAYYSYLQGMNGVTPNVIGMDLLPPSIDIEGVSFIKGDSKAIEDAFPAKLLEKCPRPFLIVEDTHVNVGGIIRYFDRFLQEDDYLLIEDIDAEEDLFPFLSNRNDYKVDTRYTDLFGYNNTCSRDQIFRKVE